MGILSRAMKNRKKEMLNTLEEEAHLQSYIPTPVVKLVQLPDELAIRLAEMAQMRNTSVELIVTTRLTAVVNAFQNQKILRLEDEMPYGQYRGTLVEDMIRSDPRYVNWLASSSDIFVLDEASTALLKELS